MQSERAPLRRHDDLTRLLRLRDERIGKPLARLLRRQAEAQYHPPAHRAAKEDGDAAES